MAKVNYSVVNLQSMGDRLGIHLEEQIEDGGQFTHVPVDGEAIKPRSIVFILDSDGQLAFVGRLKRSVSRVAMGQRRLKGDRLTKIGRVNLVSLPNKIQALLSRYLSNTASHLGEATGKLLRENLIQLQPELEGLFQKLEQSLQPDFRAEYDSREIILEQQKDATVLAMKVAGIFDNERNVASKKVDIAALSFLDTIDGERISEDRLIEHDSSVFSDWSKQDREHISSGTEFVEGRNRMTVFTANRRPLEEVFGVDLIYVDAERKSVTFVQYKMMDRKTKNNDPYFYPGAGNHNTELARMRSFQSFIDQRSRNRNLLNDIRANISPLFFKLCTVTNLKKDENNVAIGLYVPLDHWNVLLTCKETLGPNKGRQIGFHTVGDKYFTTTQFVELLKRNMIGTREDIWPQISSWVRQLLTADKSVVIAIKREIGRK